MATMYVSYIGGVSNAVAKQPLGSVTIDTSAVTAKTAAEAPVGATIAYVWSDVAHYVNTGPQATVTAAASTGLLVPANEGRHLALNRGDGIAAITV